MQRPRAAERAACAALACLVAASAAAQQARGAVSRESEGGLHTARLETPQGSIYVNLPDDLAAGDEIHGTVSYTPSGRTDVERERNLGELRGYVVDVADEPVADTPTWVRVLPERPGPVVVRFRGPRGAPAGETPIPVSAPPPTPAPPPPSLEVPTYGQAGHPVAIGGPFSGAPGDTVITIGGQEAPFLARSPRQTIARIPSEVEGLTNIRIEHEGEAAEAPFRVLTLALSADKLDLQRGQRTTLRLVVGGLADLEQRVPLTLTNRSPEVIRLGSAEVERLAIGPEDVGPDGTYRLERPIQSLRTGGFAVNAVTGPAPRTRPPTLVQSEGGCPCKELTVRGTTARVSGKDRTVTVSIPFTADIACGGSVKTGQCKGVVTYADVPVDDWSVTYERHDVKPPQTIVVTIRPEKVSGKLAQPVAPKAQCAKGSASADGTVEATVELPARPPGVGEKVETKIVAYSGTVAVNLVRDCIGPPATTTLKVAVEKAAPAGQPKAVFEASDLDGDGTLDFLRPAEPPCDCRRIEVSMTPAAQQKKATTHGKTTFLELKLDYELTLLCAGSEVDECRGALVPTLEGTGWTDTPGVPAVDRKVGEVLSSSEIRCRRPCKPGKADPTKGSLLYKVGLERSNKDAGKGTVVIVLTAKDCLAATTTRFVYEIDATKDPPTIVEQLD